MLAGHDEGKGKPVVLLHAFPLHSGMWRPQTKRLAKKNRLILPDLPGFGKSPPQAEPSISEMARAVAMLLDQLGIKEPVFMAGLSMGGYVALEFLRQFSGRVKGLGLFATRATADTEEARNNRFRSIETIERFGIEPYVKKIVKSQLGKTTQELSPGVLTEASNIMNSNPANSAIDALRAMAERRDSGDLLASISFPVLVVAGEEDTLATPAEMRGMHEKIRGSEFHEIPRAGHLINLEQPDAFNHLLETFLEKNSF